MLSLPQDGQVVISFIVSLQDSPLDAVENVANHEAKIALAVAYYSFCWKHGTLKT